MGYDARAAAQSSCLQIPQERQHGATVGGTSKLHSSAITERSKGRSPSVRWSPRRRERATYKILPSEFASHCPRSRGTDILFVPKMHQVAVGHRHLPSNYPQSCTGGSKRFESYAAVSNAVSTLLACTEKYMQENMKQLTNNCILREL